MLMEEDSRILTIVTELRKDAIGQRPFLFMVIISHAGHMKSSIHGHKGPPVILLHDEAWLFHSVSVIGFRQCLDNPVFHHGGTDWIDRHIM